MQGFIGVGLDGGEGGRDGLQVEISTVEKRASRMGSTVPIFGFVLTRRRIAKMITKMGIRKMRTRIAFWFLLIWSFRRIGKGVSMTGVWSADWYRIRWQRCRRTEEICDDVRDAGEAEDEYSSILVGGRTASP